MVPLESHFSSCLKLLRIVGRPVNVKVLLHSGSGVIAVWETIDHRLRQQWPGIEFTRPYTGGVTAQVAEGRSVDMKMQTIPLQLTLVSPWGDVRITLPFVVVPGQADVVILGDKTSKGTWTSTL